MKGRGIMKSNEFSKAINEYGAIIAKTLKDIHHIIENPAFIKSRAYMVADKQCAYNKWNQIQVRTRALDTHYLRPLYDKLKGYGDERMAEAVELLGSYGDNMPYAKANNIIDRLKALAELATLDTTQFAIRTGNELLETVKKHNVVAR